jgi:hemerythrin-like metal-binding protein
VIFRAEARKRPLLPLDADQAHPDLKKYDESTARIFRRSTSFSGAPHDFSLHTLQKERLPMTHPNTHTPDMQWPSTPSWVPDMSSGASPMNHLHHELFQALDALTSSEDREFGARYTEFVGKVERTFREEEQWMDDLDFPGFAVHQEQHARVLAALHNIHTQVMTGKLELGRQLAEELLPQWLAFHISTMDAGYVATMQVAPNGRAFAPEPS